MAYTKNTWASGDVVTSAKLNNIENGIASGGVLVVTDTNGVLDKTWAEIVGASLAVLIAENAGGMCVYTLALYGQSEGQGYGVVFYNAMISDGNTYSCASPTDYPDSNYSP